LNEKELIQFCRQVQENRVVAFNEFNNTFKEMLKQGSFLEYPTLVTRLTPQFSSLSSDICASLTILKDLKSLAVKPFTKIQAMESEKLTLTAALHLEKIRKSECENSPIRDETSLHIFQDNCVTFQQRLDSIIQVINEVLEEIFIEWLSE